MSVMDINAEVTTQLSLIDALLSDFDKKIPQCPDNKNAKQEEETEDAMPDSTTSAERTTVSTFHCGDDVLVLNKDGRYYLGTIVELSTSNDNDLCEVGVGVARCLVKFGDGTHSWAPVGDLKLLSAPPVDDGRIMCVVCKRREGPAASPEANAIIACDMCGRGYHAKCHSPPVEAWINGASWHCKRCVEQRYRVAAAENRALRRSDVLRYGQLSPSCVTASTPSSTASEAGREQEEAHCYCGEKSDWLAQMLCCCRCLRWFHQRCVSSLQYPLYAGDKLYIFACATCNGGTEYLRRLELCWLQLAHLALYNLTAYNAPNYFDLDTVIMPYIMDNWHALQLTEKMWRTPVKERREKILTALQSSRKRFKCGREMKKRATIWGLRLRRPPPPPACLAQLAQIKKGVSLTDELVREHAPRLRFLSRVDTATHSYSSQPTSSNGDKSAYSSQHMIVPVDGHWLSLMMGKRFHENLTHSDHDSTSSSNDSPKSDHLPSPTPTVSSTEITKDNKTDVDDREKTPVPLNTSLVPSSVALDKIPKDETETERESPAKVIDLRARIATMNLEISKLSTKNIIEHSKIMSLQHMDRVPSNFNDVESSSDETSSRGTLDTIIPPLKDFQGKNNPFLMHNNTSNKKIPFSSAMNSHNKQNGKKVRSFDARFSLPSQLNGVFVRPVKRKLSEKDIIIGPNGEVKRRKFRRPKKYLDMQLNKSCPLPEDNKPPAPPRTTSPHPPPSLHGRRLRQRQEKNYYENARRNTSAPPPNNSVKSLQLSPHKVNVTAAEQEAKQLSELKSSVASYFRATQRYRVLARRRAPHCPPAYLIEWETA